MGEVPYSSMSIYDWAEHELAPWRGVKMHNIETRLTQAAEHDPTIAIYDMAGSETTLRPLSMDRVPSHKQGMIRQRAEMYRTLLCEAAPHIGPVPLAVRLDDRGPHLIGTPIFAFQKHRFESVILLPDVDILGSDLLAEHDPLAFEQKRSEAIFVGSTTGGVVTADKIESNTHIRIRSARYFADKPGVTFELPSIVQCDTPETERMVANLGIGDRRWEWADQLQYKYLLSIDGNGATCSRVVKALASNSALVKYASAHLLFYFYGLAPWVNFIPVVRDSEVCSIVRQYKDTQVRDKEIAYAGRLFAESHLTRQSVILYTKLILDKYARIATG